MLDRMRRGPRSTLAATIDPPSSDATDAAWLAKDLLLVVLGATGMKTEAPNVLVSVDGETMPVESRCLSYSASDSWVSTAGSHTLLAVFLPNAGPGLEAPWTLL